MLTKWQRKWLTEYIGECWHSIKKKEVCGCHYQCTCDATFIYRDVADVHAIDNNRTFTTWADLGVVKEAIVKEGKFEEYKRRKKEIPADASPSEYLDYVTSIAKELGI